jgi:type IV secretion system protein VirB9
MGDTTSGNGDGKRTHILVKPFSAGLATNLVITTDRRSYHLNLSSTSGPAMAALSWTYPQDELLALKRMQAVAEAAAPVAGDVAVESLNFNYAIEGDQPAWRPIRAFDDGRQVFIEFPPSMPTGEAPPLFVIGSSGRAELVNYRQRGLYYVIDRLFSAAELRLGEKRQQVVRIVRADLSQRRRQGSAS